MSGFCNICGMPNCERNHMNVDRSSYEGTLQELQSVQAEIGDVQGRRAELNRLEDLLQQHRQEILRKLDLKGTPIAAR